MQLCMDWFKPSVLLMLQAALSLQRRPMLHCSTLLAAINLVVYLLSTYQSWLCPRLFACAWISHHLRDSIRRGLWIAPFGHTAPLPKLIYLTSISLLPICMRMFGSRDISDQRHSLVAQGSTLAWVKRFESQFVRVPKEDIIPELSTNKTNKRLAEWSQIL
jgi:hypothetical protein